MNCNNPQLYLEKICNDIWYNCKIIFCFESGKTLNDIKRFSGITGFFKFINLIFKRMIFKSFWHIKKTPEPETIYKNHKN